MQNLTSINAAKEPSFIVTRHGTTIEISSTFTKMTGYSTEDLLNKKFNHIADILRIGPNIDMNNIDKDKDYFLFTKTLDVKFVNIEVIEELHGDKYIFTINSDFSLDVNLSLANRLCEDSYHGIAIFSIPDITLLRANDTFCSFFDKPYNKKEKCIGRSVSEFVTNFKGSTSEKIWQDIIATGKTFNIDEYRYDGFERGVTYWRSTITPIYYKGKFKFCFEMTTEITEQVLHRKQIEEQARIIEEQKRELELVLDNMTDGFSIISRDGTYSKTNKRIIEWLQNASTDKIGATLSDVKYFDMKGKELTLNELPASRILRGEVLDQYEVLMKLNDTHKYFSISGTPIYDSNGNLLMGVVNTRDITNLIYSQQALKLAQIQLLQKEREENEALEKAIEMKDEFLSLISHEFRTPINVISAATQAMDLICGGELSDNAKKYLSMIRQNTFRQLRLVNNLLDITRANAGRIKINKTNLDIVFITRATTDSVNSYALQKGVKLTFRSSLKEKVIGIDEEKYERILLNLLSNAIKFTPKGNSISVELKTIRKQVCIEVKDTGIGIPVDKIKLIFERFGQVDSLLSRQAEGAGIGLSLVEKFVKALDGKILVKSKIGKGSTFTVLLPGEPIEEANEKPMVDLMDNHLVQVSNIEFSDIYS